jgi:hypothetical protein
MHLQLRYDFVFCRGSADGDICFALAKHAEFFGVFVSANDIFLFN